MGALREWGRRLAVMLKLRRMEDEIGEEMQFHIEMLAQEKRGAGLNSVEAGYAARRQFGNPAVLKERSRDAWGWTFWDQFAQDMRHAFRSVLHSPMQAFLIITTLGLAMAANLAVFSLLDQVIMRPLPVEKPSELVLLSASQPEPRKILVGGMGPDKKPMFGIDYPLFKDLRDHVHVLQGMTAFLPMRAMLSGNGDPVPVNGVLVTGNYFDLLGVKSQLGRTLNSADDLAPDGNGAVVLTHGFWQRQFGGDPSILNKTIRLNRQPRVVVGITTPGFTGTVTGLNADLFIPLNQAAALVRFPGFKYDEPGYSIYSVMARLAPGLDIQKAERVAERVYNGLLAQSAANAPSPTAEHRIYHVRLFPGGYASSQPSKLSYDMKTPLSLLMAMVALVLIVAAGNVANLLLAKRMLNAQSTAIRYALGSSRWRVLRELLLESLLLSACATVAGYFLAYWTAHLIPVLLGIPKLPEGISTRPDQRSCLFAIGVALIIGIGIWGASAIRATKRSRLPALTENASPGGTVKSVRWRRGMVVLQISFSLILLCASFVLCRSLINLMSVDPGFSVDNLYSFSINYGQAGYEGPRAQALVSQITDQVRAIPGVRMAAVGNIPLAGGASVRHVNDRPVPMDDKGTRSIIVSISTVYFKTLGIPLTAGREFSQEDIVAGARVAVLNESLARALCGTTNPVGRHVWLGGESTDVEIVGLVKDTKGISLRAPIYPTLYWPAVPGHMGEQFSVLLRTSGPPVTLNAVRAAVKQVDTSVPLLEFGSVADQVSQTLYRDRAMAILSLCFAGLASILCAVGVFGLTSYSIAGRTKEIGVRIALGADSRSIYRLVLKETVLLSFTGCAVGLAGFIAVSRIFRTLLYQLTPTDPASLVWAILVLGVTTFLAGYVPSRRAARLNPSVALRWE